MKKISTLALSIIFIFTAFSVYAVGPRGCGEGIDNWSTLVLTGTVPAGFADGTDDESAVGGWGSSVEKTLVSDIVTLAGQGYYSIDTEGDAGSDDCTKFLGLSDGDEIIIRPESGDRTVVIKNGAFCNLASGKDFIMNNVNDRIRLLCIGSDVCVESALRSNGGD